MLNSSNYPVLFILTASLLTGCASTKSEKASSTGLNQAQTKIGFAIGRETGSFKISSQRESEAPGGSNRTDYEVMTSEGTKYNCYIMEPSSFGKFMSWGMASGSDAVCSAISSGAIPQPSTNCNSLLKAAGKC